MSATRTTTHEDFLHSLRERHERQRHHDQAYEAMMYRARDPPNPETLRDIIRFTSDERPEDTEPPALPDGHAAPGALSGLVRTMRWPDPSPLRVAADALPGWDTLHVSTFLHTMIPDYPIWGPSESTGLRHLGIDLPYVDDPRQAIEPYGRYVHTVKGLREEARFEDVPESHHYLTRIVQSGLQELGER